jgi:hypothetical protein
MFSNFYGAHDAARVVAAKTFGSGGIEYSKLVVEPLRAMFLQSLFEFLAQCRVGWRIRQCSGCSSARA